MTQVTITVDTHLRFDDSVLDERAMRLLRSALDVRNPENPEEEILLAKRDWQRRLVLPRGFAYKLHRGLTQFGYDVVWDDQRVQVPVDLPLLQSWIEDRPYQTKAAGRMAYVEQGIYEGPTAAGKTIAGIMFISGVQQRAIIHVNRINIATQWQNRIRDALNYEAGIIGDGIWDERDITIAVIQTLWARRQQLTASGWWRNWGVMMLDECHAVSAPSVREIVQMYPAYFRIGLSATPDRHTWMQRASRGILGEIICRTTDDELEEAGVLVRPNIVAVRTPFQFRWNGQADYRREWQRLVKALKFDKGRNTVIAKIAAAQRGHACILHTDQTTHADELAGYIMAAGWPRDRVMMLTGREDRDQRERVIEMAAEGDCFIISTIGQEAMDIPRLDRFFLVWPTKNPTPVKQMVGRVKRTHAEKDHPIVFDFWDHLVRKLSDQFAVRRGTYDRDKLPLTVL